MRIYFIRLTGGGNGTKKQRRDEELLQKIILRVKELRRLHDHQSQEELAEATGWELHNSNPARISRI